MITDHDIAALCAGIYATPGQPLVAWDQLELPPDGISFGIKDLCAATALIFRGSITIGDWLRDAETVADPFLHEGLGPFILGSSKVSQSFGLGSSLS